MRELMVLLCLVLSGAARGGEYTSLWYHCCASDGVNYYSGGAGTFPSNQRPMAVRSGAKTYFVFTNGQSVASIGAYDHRTERFSAPVAVGLVPDGNGHGNPSLLVDDDRYIYVFYGSHSTSTLVKRSRRPENTLDWDDRAPIEGRTTYPQPWQLLPQTITVLHRCEVANQCIRRSMDGAASWSDATTIIAVDDVKNKGVYAISVAGAGAYPRKLHVMWTVIDFRIQERRHFYYARSEDGGTTWMRSDGSAYELPIAAEGAERIFDSGGDQVNTNDIQVDARGRVHALISSGRDRTWRWSLLDRDEAGQWRSRQIPAFADHQFDIGALALAGRQFRAFLPSRPTQPGLNGGGIDEWTSRDGDAWVRRGLTGTDCLSHNNVKSVYGATRDFLVFWSCGDARYEPESRESWLYGYGARMQTRKIVLDGWR
jgi:hypothetical protein